MINSRRKGKAGELEAAAYLSSLFNQPCRRGQQYSGLGGADVIGIDDLHFEIKRCERLSLYPAIEQAKNDAGPDETPIVLHRKNRQGWLAIVQANDLIPLTAAILRLAKHLNNSPAEEKHEPTAIN